MAQGLSSSSLLARAATWIGVALALFLCVSPLSDFDTFWHLANGRLMVQTGSIVDTERFSYSAAGTPFDNHAWLAQVVMYLAWAGLGVSGLLLLKLLVVGAIVLFTLRTLRFYGVAPVPAALYAVWMVVGGMYLLTERPNLFSLLFLAVVFHVLEAHRVGRYRSRVLWWLPPVFVVWDVTHGSLYGTVLLLAYVGGSALSRLVTSRWQFRSVITDARLRAEILATGAVLAVVLVSPWGWLGSGFFAQLLGDNAMVASVGEFQRTPLLLAFVPFWITFAVAGVVVVAATRRRDFSTVLVLVAFGILAWRFSRATAPFCIVAVPLIARYLGERWGEQAERVRHALARSADVALIVAIAGAAVYKVVLPPHVNSLGVGINADSFPSAALKFLDAHGIGGNAFNSGELGGYLAFAAPARKIFLYNHHTVFADAMNSLRMPGAARRWNFNYALLGHTWQRYRYVFPIEEWAPVYWEPATMVMLRRTPDNAAVIAANEIRFFSPDYSGSELRDLARDPAVFPILLRELAGYLNFRRDAEYARVFAELVRIPHAELDAAARARLIAQAAVANPDVERY